MAFLFIIRYHSWIYFDFIHIISRVKQSKYNLLIEKNNALN